MNPIIHYGSLINGELVIPLAQPCKCLIGLVSLQIPNINHRGDGYKELNIYCDQLDSNMANRKRLLRRICTNNQPEYVSTFEFPTVLYFPVDSSDSKLTLRFHDQHGFIEIPETFARRANMQTVTVCLNVIPEDVAKEQWIKYI